MEHWTLQKDPQSNATFKEQEGSIITNAWIDINPLHSSDAERLGYPTQKPLELLERIIQASSNPGDIVLAKSIVLPPSTEANMR